MKNKQGLKYNIQLFVQLLDDLENHSIDIPAAVNARVDMAYRGLSGCLFELILSQEEDLEYKRSVIKKFVSIRSQNIPVFPDKPAVAAKPVVSKVKHHNVVHSGLKVRERAENSAFYFFDSFTNNENDWATNSDSTKMMGVVNGKFRIEGKSNRGFQSVRNFELDLTKDFSCTMVKAGNFEIGKR
nr:hypothetical protein [Pedobacter sp. ASV19]